MHMYVSKLTISGSDNGLSSSQRQAIIWTNAGILLIRPLGKNLNEFVIEIHTFSFKKIHLNTSYAKCWPSCLDLNVLTQAPRAYHFQDGPFLLTSINLNPSMDKKVWDDSDEIAYPKSFIHSQTSKVSNFISHFIMDVITYPSWD